MEYKFFRFGLRIPSSSEVEEQDADRITEEAAMLANCAEWLETLTICNYSLMVNLRPDEDSGTLHKREGDPYPQANRSRPSGIGRNSDLIRHEAAADGIYVLRTKVPAESLKAEDAKTTYHSLSHVEWAFRSLKGMDLQIRSIHHRLEDRVRSHVFLCMLAYDVEWHLRKAWEPMLFDGEPQGVSNGKRRTKRTPEGHPVMAFGDLMADLGGLTRNQVLFAGATNPVGSVKVHR